MTKALGRITDGLSLIGKEVLKRSLTLPNSDFQSLFKKAILSVTDLSGLTSGTLRQFPGEDKDLNRRRRALPQHRPAPHISSSSSPSPHSNSNSNSKSSDGQEIPLPRHIPTPPSSDTNTTTEAASLVVVGSINQANLTSNHTSAARDPNNAIEDANIGVVKNEEKPMAPTPTPKRPSPRRPRERRVPSTPFSRAIGFAGLGAGLAWGTIQESARRLVFGMPISSDKQSALSPFLSQKNAERLALALCRMRGAALKLGQMLSIQDESVIPAPVFS